MRFTTIHAVCLLAIISSHSIAADIRINGTISHILKESTYNKSLSQNASHSVKEIKLLKVELSEKAKTRFATKAKSLMQNPQLRTATSKLSPSIQLGMNDVPVLDQGRHGSCVTFAATAAIDALIKKGDYVSQLCQLQLGNYLENQAYGTSGWNGSLGRFVLNQMDLFGIVNKSKESQVGCGGLTSYPLEGDDPKSLMNMEDYHQMSESLSQHHITWSPILADVNASDRLDTNKTLADVKASLVVGDRVTFAVLLLDFDLGTVGAVGTKNAPNDTWVLTPQILRDIWLNPTFGGHEMVITGYDDDAIAIDDEGRQHRGLLTLRNSWSKELGDQGNFYISYDYFKLLVVEAYRIRTTDDPEGDDA